jgi:hypothetical protein
MADCIQRIFGDKNVKNFGYTVTDNSPEVSGYVSGYTSSGIIAESVAQTTGNWDYLDARHTGIRWYTGDTND